jgi:hypothetical protein
VDLQQARFFLLRWLRSVRRWDVIALPHDRDPL